MLFKYLTLNTSSEIICFLVALTCLSGSRYRIWQLFIPYLFIVCMVELTGIYLKSLHHANQWPYNILLICQIVFNSLLFTVLLSRYIRPGLMIVTGVSIVALFYLFEILSHGFLVFNSVTYDAMCILFMLYSFYYYYLLMRDEQYIIISRSPEFWIVAGTLLFYFGSTSVNIFRGKLSNIIIGNYTVTHYIYNILNMVFYTCWSYAFICRKWLIPTSKA